MRGILLLLIFFCGSFQLKAATLQLDLSACRTAQISESHQIKIFKEDLNYKTIYLDYLSGFDTILTELPIGTYFFEFLTIFNTTERDTLRILKDTVYYKSICVDDFKYLPTPFKSHIDSLNNHESFTIEFESIGCFHWSLRKIKVSIENGQCYATLYPIKFIRDNNVAKGKPRTIKLSDSKIDIIRKFELNNYMYSTGYLGSTEVTYFTFKYKKHVLKFVDSEESRERFKLLISMLFGH